MAYVFSKQSEEKFQWLLSRYPKKDAVLLPLLHHVQEEVGYLSPDAIDYVGERLGLSPARVREVASFYSMFRLNKKGQYVIQVCHNISCYLGGCEDLLKKCKDVLGIAEGETTPDGKFTLERVECLASCGTAPVLQVNNWDFHESLTPEKVETILKDLKQDKHAKPSYDDRAKEGSIA
jgi:NADH-quinone oxidoreductase subunit E